MASDKTIYFLAGLPRSGSTLLANILAQNPRHYVTPTSGIVDMLVQVRNGWDANDAFWPPSSGCTGRLRRWANCRKRPRWH